VQVEVLATCLSFLMRDKVDGIVEGLAIRTYGQDLQQQEQQQGEGGNP
jgi:hypothetical protein